jgi:hypothetical protein
MTKKSREETKKLKKFYAWLVACGNIYLHDNDQITRAFDKIVAN